MSSCTQRAFHVETFTLDELGASALPQCTGAQPLATIAGHVAARVGIPTAEALRGCVDLVRQLGRARLLEVGEAASLTR